MVSQHSSEKMKTKCRAFWWWLGNRSRLPPTSTCTFCLMFHSSVSNSILNCLFVYAILLCRGGIEKGMEAKSKSLVSKTLYKPLQKFKSRYWFYFLFLLFLSPLLCWKTLPDDILLEISF